MLTLARSKNPLVYPGDRQPGYDQSHPAAGVGASAIATAARNIIGLAAWKVGVLPGTAPASTIGANGPALTFSGTARAQVPSVTNFANGFTAAAIFQKTTNQATSLGQVTVNTGSSGGNGTFVRNSDQALAVNTTGGLTTTTGIILANAPYFVAWSMAGGQTSINVVVLRLDTGQLSTAIVSQATTPAGTGANLIMGNSNGGTAPLTCGSVSCMMHSSAVLSLAQLTQWAAADPWSFWYPPRVEQLLIMDEWVPPPIFPATYQRNQRIIMTG
jgi:hypothetical protein